MDLKTTDQKTAYLIQQVPAAQSNYKLLLLLYWQVFDGVQIPKEIISEILLKGTEPETIGRSKRRAVGIVFDPEETLNKILQIFEEEEVNS